MSLKQTGKPKTD